MSDNIPFDILMEIFKKVSDFKSLIQFRSVSKPWKSFIDSSDFIKGYGARHTQPYSYILRYRTLLPFEKQHICLVDDNFETLQVQEFVVSPLLKQYCSVDYVVGTCHGLVCLYVDNGNCYCKHMLVVWNPSIGKSFGIGTVPSYDPRTGNVFVYGFGVCPVTSDPTVVKVLCGDNMPWHVEVFTLSSGVWNVIPGGNLPRQSIELNSLNQVVIDRFIYWGAREKTFIINHAVVSFDLITKEFQVVDLPHSLTNGLSTWKYVSVSKLRGSLVVFGYGVRCGVWVMEHDSSFRKLFSIGTRFSKILGFKKNGETIFLTRKGKPSTRLDVYDPSSQQIKNLEISGLVGSFFMESYKQSLLLLDHSESHIYCDDKKMAKFQGVDLQSYLQRR